MRRRSQIDVSARTSPGVGELGEQRAAEAELLQRQKKRKKLDIVDNYRRVHAIYQSHRNGEIETEAARQASCTTAGSSAVLGAEQENHQEAGT